MTIPFAPNDAQFILASSYSTDVTLGLPNQRVLTTVASAGNPGTYNNLTLGVGLVGGVNTITMNLSQNLGSLANVSGGGIVFRSNSGGTFATGLLTSTGLTIDIGAATSGSNPTLNLDVIANSSIQNVNVQANSSSAVNASQLVFLNGTNTTVSVNQPGGEQTPAYITVNSAASGTGTISNITSTGLTLAITGAIGPTTNLEVLKVVPSVLSASNSPSAGYVPSYLSSSQFTWVANGGGGGAVSSVTGNGDISVSPTTGPTVVSLASTLTQTYTFENSPTYQEGFLTSGGDVPILVSNSFAMGADGSNNGAPFVKTSQYNSSAMVWPLCSRTLTSTANQVPYSNSDGTTSFIVAPAGSGTFDLQSVNGEFQWNAGAGGGVSSIENYSGDTSLVFNASIGPVTAKLNTTLTGLYTFNNGGISITGSSSLNMNNNVIIGVQSELFIGTASVPTLAANQFALVGQTVGGLQGIPSLAATNVNTGTAGWIPTINPVSIVPSGTGNIIVSNSAYPGHFILSGDAPASSNIPSVFVQPGNPLTIPNWSNTTASGTPAAGWSLQLVGAGPFTTQWAPQSGGGGVVSSVTGDGTLTSGGGGQGIYVSPTTGTVVLNTFVLQEFYGDDSFSIGDIGVMGSLTNTIGVGAGIAPTLDNSCVIGASSGSSAPNFLFGINKNTPTAVLHLGNSGNATSGTYNGTTLAFDANNGGQDPSGDIVVPNPGFVIGTHTLGNPVVYANKGAGVYGGAMMFTDADTTGQRGNLYYEAAAGNFTRVSGYPVSATARVYPVLTTDVDDGFVSLAWTTAPSGLGATIPTLGGTYTPPKANEVYRVTGGTLVVRFPDTAELGDQIKFVGVQAQQWAVDGNPLTNTMIIYGETDITDLTSQTADGWFSVEFVCVDATSPNQWVLTNSFGALSYS